LGEGKRGGAVVDSAVREKIELLISRHFPWGKGAHPNRTSSDESDGEYVKMWLIDQAKPFQAAATALIARICNVLDELEEQLPDDEKPRLFARIDAGAILKSPEGILEKMVRDWAPSTGRQPYICFENFVHQMEDIGRFRIVANFLSDADTIADHLQTIYDTSSPLSKAAKALRGDFLLKDNSMKDKIKVLPADRMKGERCRQGVFFPREASIDHLKVEVQVLTILGEAWDKKDHFLIYEPRRRGEPIRKEHQIEMFAVSELLYVADLTFDRIKEAVIRERSEKGRK